MRKSKTLIFCAVLTASLCVRTSPAQTWSTLNYPGSAQTQIRGISGGNVVGNYINDFTTSPEHGFIYNGSTFTTIDDPLAGNMYGLGTIPTAVAPNGTIVGYYYAGSQIPDGFVYNGSSYTKFNHPAGLNGTYVNGISSGGTIVGTYVDASYKNHGFRYNGSTYTTLDDPLASSQSNQGTFAMGIANDSVGIVGYYVTPGTTFHGFLYNGSTYSTLDYLGSTFTEAFGITGSAGNYKIVGAYYDAGSDLHGFLYNQAGSTWTTLDYPGTLSSTIAQGIDGNKIVGEYSPDTFESGFLLTVPEPAGIMLAFLGVGALVTCGRSVRRRT